MVFRRLDEEVGLALDVGEGEGEDGEGVDERAGAEWGRGSGWGGGEGKPREEERGVLLSAPRERPKGRAHLDVPHVGVQVVLPQPLRELVLVDAAVACCDEERVLRRLFKVAFLPSAE